VSKTHAHIPHKLNLEISLPLSRYYFFSGDVAKNWAKLDENEGVSGGGMGEFVENG